MACCPCWEGVFGTGDAKLELKNRKVPVSALILGCAPIGCGWAGDVPESTAESTVLQALSLGIRYVDTAPWYGAGLSEQRLGKALATAQSTTKEQVAVSTKVGRYMVTKAEAASHGTRVDSGYDFNTENYHNNVPVWDYRKEGTEESLRQSRQRLQRNFIDCLRVHDAEDPERWEETCSPDGAIAVLVSLREKGEIGQVSLGFNSVPYLMKTIQKYPNGTFDNIMMARTWNLLDQSSYPLLLECQKRGIKVHLAAVFCAGLLWGQNFFMYRSEIPPELTEKVARWKELSTSYGFSLPQVALAFAFLPSCVERVAVGCASPEQVRGNVELCDVKVPLELWQKAQASGLLPQHLQISE